MANDLNLAMKLFLDSRQFVSGLGGSNRAVTGFSNKAVAEISRVRNAWTGVQGKLAAVGVGVGAVATAVQSAQIDKNLRQIALTAGVGESKIEILRKRLWALSNQSGKPFENLMTGFNSLVQSGLGFDQALATMDGMNKAMAVSGANAEVLSQALTVASRAFKFDLSNPATATAMLEKMTVAGRLGNAELEALSGVFGRVGTPSANAGMSFDETLAMAEGLSQGLPGQPERLGTRMESTLRFFNNFQYLKNAESQGIRFFNNGKRIPTFDVLEQIKQRVDAAGGNEEKRVKTIGKLLMGMDQDTAFGINDLISGNNLQQVRGYKRDVANAGGIFKDNMVFAMDNAVDQAARLKATLREAADGFAKPINEVLTKAAQKLLDGKDKGGLGLNGTQLLEGGAAVFGTAYLAKRLGGPLLKTWAGKLTGVAEGVGVGKVLEQAAGVTPVYVVNMPGDGMLGNASVPSAAKDAVKKWGTWDLLKGTAAAWTAQAAPALVGLTAMASGPAALWFGRDYLPTGSLNPEEQSGFDYAQSLRVRQGLKAAEFRNDNVKAEAITPEAKAVLRNMRSGSPSMEMDGFSASIARALASRSAGPATNFSRKPEQFEGAVTVSIEDNRTRVKQLSSKGTGWNLETNLARGTMMVMP